MKYRKLRIAWSVIWGVVAVLFCVMWVRSYWRLDVWEGNIQSATTIVRADAGLVTYSRSNFGNTSSDQSDWVHVAENASMGMNYWQFDWAWRSDIFLIRTPIWVPMIAVTILAGVPWIGWSKQFTIRTMLITTALVAFVLGILVSFE